MNIEKHYHLLPFRFERIGSTEVLVNEVGDYLFAPLGTARQLAEGRVGTDSELYKDLEANFFVSPKPITPLIDNLATRYRTKKAFLDSFTALHIFVLTLRCNQNCVYCQASSKQCAEQPFDISFDNLSAAVSLMFRSPSPHLTMEFQGGEPTLAFEKMKFAVQKAEELNAIHHKKITYVVCTNSVDPSDELLAFCKQHHILISTSLDGPEWLHNQNRAKADSYARVVAGIAKERAALRSDNISALMTTSWLSLDYPRQIVDAYRENGFTSIFLRALNPYGLAKENGGSEQYTDRFVEFYKTALDYILELNQHGTYFVEEFTALLLRKMTTPFPIGFVDLQSPAGIVNGVVVYHYDGYVYASDESRMLAEHGDYTFRLGHVTDCYKDIFLGKTSMALADVWANEALAGCSDCAFQAYCGADPVRNYAVQGDAYGHRPSSSFCKKHKAIVRHLFSILIERPEVVPVFKSWINKF